MIDAQQHDDDQVVDDDVSPETRAAMAERVEQFIALAREDDMLGKWINGYERSVGSLAPLLRMAGKEVPDLDKIDPVDVFRAVSRTADLWERTTPA